MMEQNRFIQPFVPTYAPLPERTPSLMEKLSTAKMFVDDTGMGWSYAPPKADGFWQSQYTRREWMYLEMPGGLTGRHMGAEQQMERLSDPSAALTEMGKDEDRARSFIGTTVPFAARSAKLNCFTPCTMSSTVSFGLNLRRSCTACRRCSTGS